MTLLLYCTKEKNKSERLMISCKGEFKLAKDFLYITDYPKIFNGKIVAECDFEVEEIFEDNFEDARDGYVEHFYKLGSYDDFGEGQKVLLKESCLQKHELSNYLDFENGYAIHIKNLNIFDEPRELSEYYSEYYVKDIGFTEVKLRKAPQNMQYCYNVCNQKYILISIRPEWLCKILNGEKTIEVRKKVLRGMIK